MTKQEIKEKLCYYDLRNPDGVNETRRSYGLDAGEIKKEVYGNHKKEDCYCDNCFNGRTKMAEELLKLENQNKQLRIGVVSQQRELLNSFAEWLKEEDDDNFIGKYTVGAYLETVQKQ